MTHDIDAETDAMGRLGRGTLVSVLRPTAASGTPNAQNCITSDLLHPSCQVATSELLSFFRSPMIERNRARQSHHNVSLPAFFSLLFRYPFPKHNNKKFKVGKKTYPAPAPASAPASSSTS